VSYCRFDDKSDVYIYSSGRTISCHITKDVVAQKELIDDYYYVSYTEDKPEEVMLSVLDWLQKKWDVKVPYKAISRLRKEALKRSKENTKYD